MANSPEHSSLSAFNSLPSTLIAQAVIDSLPDPVVLFDTAGEGCAMNRATAIFLRDPVPLPSHDVLQHIDPAVRTVLRRLCAHVLDGQEPYVAQGPTDLIRLPSQQGEQCFLPRATPLYTAQGQFIGVTVLFHPTTEAAPPDTEHEEQWATLVHDLRTPLTSLQAAVQLCLERMVGPLTEKQARLLQIARESCERLQTTLEGLTDRQALLRTKPSSRDS